MSPSQRFRPALLVCLLLTATFLVQPPDAAAAGEGWLLRFGGVWVDPDVNVDTIDSAGSRARARSVDDINLGVGAEYRFSRRLGLDLGVAFAEPEIGLTVDFPTGQVLAATSGIDFTPITAGLNFHFTPDSRFDLYAGPLLGYVLYGDVGFDAGDGLTAEFESKDDFALGAQLGADIAIGKGGWSVNMALKYLAADLQVSDLDDGERTDVSFDPIMFNMGLGYRF